LLGQKCHRSAEISMRVPNCCCRWANLASTFKFNFTEWICQISLLLQTFCGFPRETIQSFNSISLLTSRCQVDRLRCKTVRCQINR
jgi:hypothetical protein